MTSIDINLLPKQAIVKTQQNNLTFLSKVSIAALALTIFLTGVTLILRFTQKVQIDQNKSLLSQAEAKVNSYKDKETQFLVLRKYLDSISTLSTSDSKRKSLFNLMVFLAPNDVLFTDVSIANNGDTVFSATTTNLASIDKLLVDLIDEQKNSGLVSKVDLEGLSLGKDNIYHFGFRISPK